MSIDNHQSFPLWTLALIAGCAPAVQFLIRFRRREKINATKTLCRRCGYDLRATPEKCPECGTAAVTI